MYLQISRRPFIAALYAVLYDGRASGAPSGHLWRSQLDVTLSWFASFLLQERGALVRTFDMPCQKTLQRKVLVLFWGKESNVAEERAVLNKTVAGDRDGGDGHKNPVFL